MTNRQLLDHMSGLFSYTDDRTDPARGTAVLTAEFCPRTNGTARGTAGATAAAGDGRPWA
ncbi:hypothetical protein [Streptomyces pinistramenti]|uniref:hypothetical protein n=1 Tax=Streptomyces pinistramenti TaxID=2884812 RepID=UPI001D08D3AF|nr:hypothetical protein [Streptomyces pinistramenti]MCB5911605.1 hypothetical protein [Streptomyces pinistramenti]